MIVTEVKLKNVCRLEAGVVAECSIVLDNEIQIHNVKLVSGKDGMFLAFPYLKGESHSKKYVDIVHPTNKSTRQYLTNIVISEYKKELRNLG